MPQEVSRLRRLLEHQGRELRRLAAVVSSSEDAIMCVAPEGSILTWNDGAMHVFGYEAKAIVGKPVSLLIPADIMEAEAAIFRRVMNGERIEHYETTRLHRDGTAIAVSLSISAMRDSVGGIIGVSKIERDITERKHAQRTLAESDARKSAILDASMDAIVTFDHADRIVEFNAAAERLFGLSREQATGRTVTQLIVPPEDLESNGSALGHPVKMRRVPTGTRAEVPLRRPYGSQFEAELTTVQVPGVEPPLFTTTVRDITERNRARRLLVLEHSVTRALADAENSSDALRATMRAICESEGWEIGWYLRLDEEAAVMRSAETWCGGGESMKRLSDRTSEVKYRLGEGLIGAVWQAGEPLWVSDVGDDPRVAQKSLAREAGVRSAFLYPVAFEGRVIGVLSFWTSKVRNPDQRLPQAMNVMGSQVGQFLMRRRAEDALRASASRLRAIVENEPECVKVLDGDGRLLDMNPAGLRMVEADDITVLRGRDLEHIVAAEYRDAFRNMIARVAAGGEEALEFEAIGLRGRRRWLESRSVPLRDGATGKQLILSITRDITERKRAEQKQVVLLKYQATIARFGQSALAVRDATALVEYVVREVLEALDAQAVAYVEPSAAPDELVIRVLVRDREGPFERTTIVNLPGSPLYRVLASGVHYVAEEAVLPFEWARGIRRAGVVPVQGEKNVRGVLCALGSPADAHAAEDLHFLQAAANVLSAGLQRIETERRLAVMAQFDALTGLPNRALVGDRLAQMLVGARRHAAPLAILFMDFDDFKSVNDSLGQAAGDELLREASRRLEAAVRAGDTVARFSGDEFIVLLVELARPEDAGTVAQKIIDQLSLSFQVANHEVFVTVSIGIAAFPADGDNADALIGAAEAAMHRAKQSGRNGYRFFTADIDQRLHARAKIGSELRRALERRELEVAYQAKIDLQSGLICGAEALLRWNHPERGAVAPTEFIPILEDTALIIPVGEWVLRQACLDLKTWMNNGGVPVPVAVNLSARHFGQRELDTRISGLIDEAALPASLIEVEITESQLMQDPDHAIRVMQGLRQRGIGIALDDFGTGYSSLAYLARFPVSAVKIDRSFVAGIERQQNEAAIVRTIIEMARALGFTVIAEGVENVEQLAFLRRFGCHQAQGYLFSQPLSARGFSELLLSRKEWHMTGEKARLPVAAEGASEYDKARERNANELEHLSDAEFARYLGELSGRSIRSREDVRSYIIEMSSRPATDSSSVRRWRRAKNGLLVTALAFAVFQYYAIDVLLQIISLPQLTVFAPPVAQVFKSMGEIMLGTI